MIGEELKRDDGQDRHYIVGRVRQFDNFIGDSFEMLRAISTCQSDDPVLQFSARMTLCKEISDLFHFQSAFESDRIIELPAKEKKAVHVRIFSGNRLDFVVQA